jgi:hypothetical protein
MAAAFARPKEQVMSARAIAWRLVRWSLIGALAGGGACVESLEEPELGKASFLGGVTIQSADYDEREAAAAVAPVGPAALGGASTGTGAQPSAGQAPLPGASAPAGGAERPAAQSGGMAGAPVRGAAGGPAPGAAPPAAGSAAPAGPSMGTLMIEFTSVSQGGSYAPRNVGAVWIEKADGTFIKTIERWAGIRAAHLAGWAEASGGWGSLFFPGGNTADKMDAVSRATLRTHEKHSLMWSMKDAMGMLVPDGKYKVMIEVADDQFGAGTVSGAEFDKGPMPLTVMPPDGASFSGLVITYQP